MPDMCPSLAPAARLETRKLRDLAGIGKSIEANLHSLGVTSVTTLASRDGDDLYHQLCAKTGRRQDPCVLDTFRCAVAQARDRRMPAARRNWWWWSRQRKAGKLPG
jgi:nucleotidyltransferase/DNA polymerase involved in DNA repair